jgi:hypothetical protein
VRLDSEHLLDRAVRGLAFTLHLEVPPARLGLRHLALVAFAGRSLRRGLVLADAATFLPEEVVLNLNPLGERPTRSLVERVSDEAGEALSVVGFREGRAARARLRPWRAVVAVLEGAELGEERGFALRLGASLDPPGAWLSFAYLRLAAREDLEPEGVVDGLVHLIALYQVLARPGRKRWWPWNPAGKGQKSFS